jgi:8-oxo-dGTP pyrophosphatase MutT (NUDIX family)
VTPAKERRKPTVTGSSASDIEIAALDRIDISFEPWSWHFAVERRGEIEDYFAELRRERSGVWNGRILLLHRYAVSGRRLQGACFETDYASFCAWRAWKFPDSSVYNVFAAAALRSADGAFLVGEMSSSTANSGLVTFPCGTPEPADLDAAGRLDLAANLGRELMEETGLPIAELEPEPGWTMVHDRGYLAFLKVVIAPEAAEVLRARVLRHLEHEDRPEFIDIRVVRSPADLEPGMPRFMTGFLSDFWS